MAYDRLHQTFNATFAPGATWSCLSFTSKTISITQLGKKIPYEPRKCYALDPKLTKLTDNWDDINCTMNDIANGHLSCPSGGDWNVKLEVQYETPQGIKTLSSNTLTVKH